ncbi:glycerate kinase [Kribbella sp. NPDC051770]|uniref:glycerate kinase n=1 Tax=Kribbella sp. NPDC051770 TaxID=3155413 RepID=UPI00342D70AD
MRVLVASDKFKGTLTSAEVAAAVSDGVRRVRPDAVVDRVVVADGGDGTLAAAVAAGFSFVAVRATGPTGQPVPTGYARRGDTAVVELADASGLIRLPGGVLAPMTAGTRGTGELIAAAVEAGATRVILGIGGSASTDGGAGMLRALGARLLDASGTEVADGGAALADVVSVDLEALAHLKDVEVIVACDVDNPLTGPKGAAATYGPQKGASPQQIEQLDKALTHWADLIAQATAPGASALAPFGADPGRSPAPEPHPELGSGSARLPFHQIPGSGAAGGVGFAALAVLGARLVPGIELVLELVGFTERLAGVDLVVTGEGALDDQTLHGKAVSGVASAAQAAGVPVVAVCGTNRLDDRRLRAAGIEAAYALTDLQPDVSRCIADPVPLLRGLGERIGLR